MLKRKKRRFLFPLRPVSSYLVLLSLWSALVLNARTGAAVIDPNCLPSALKIAESGKTEAVEKYKNTSNSEWDEYEADTQFSENNALFAKNTENYVDDGISTFFSVKDLFVQEKNNFIYYDKLHTDADVNNLKLTVIKKILSDPDLRAYWDHKSTWKSGNYNGLQFRIGTRDPKIIAKFEKAINEAKAQVVSQIEALGIDFLYKDQDGALSNPKTWFESNHGEAPDITDFRVRLAKMGIDPKNWKSAARKIFFDIKKSFDALDKVENLHKRGLITTIDGKKTIDLEVIDFLKKNASLPREALRLKFNEEMGRPRYLLEMGKEGFDHLYNIVDLSKAYFSLAPPQATRVSVHSVDAPNGIISVDFVGQGNLNVQTLMGHLLELKNPTGEQVLAKAREAERAATVDLRTAAEALKKDSLTLFRRFFTLSGDDGVIALLERIPEINYKQFLQTVSAIGKGRRYRFVQTEGKYIGTNEVVPPEVRSKWVLKAENLEKKVVAHVGGKLFEPLGRNFQSVMDKSSFMFKVEIPKAPSQKAKLVVYSKHLVEDGTGAFRYELEQFFKDHPQLDFEVSFR